MSTNKPIKIGILEASAQTKAILEFFFNSSGNTIFKESSIEEASVYIIDYDYPGSKDIWKKQFEKTKKPGIIISINETELESGFWISKPLTSDHLIDAGKKIQLFLENNNKTKPVIENPAFKSTIEKPKSLAEVREEDNKKQQESKQLPIEEKQKTVFAFANHADLENNNETKPVIKNPAFKSTIEKPKSLAEVREEDNEKQQESKQLPIEEKQETVFAFADHADLENNNETKPVIKNHAFQSTIEKSKALAEVREEGNEKRQESKQLPIKEKQKIVFAFADHAEKLSPAEIDQNETLIKPELEDKLATKPANYSTSSALMAISETKDINSIIDSAIEEGDKLKNSTIPPENQKNNDKPEIDSILDSLISKGENQESADINENNSFRDAQNKEQLLDKDFEENEFNIILSTIQSSENLKNTSIESEPSHLESDIQTLQADNKETQVSAKSTHYTKSFSSLNDDDLINRVNQQVMKQEDISDLDNLDQKFSATNQTVPSHNKENPSKPVSADEDLKALLEEIRLEAESVTNGIARIPYVLPGNTNTSNNKIQKNTSDTTSNEDTQSEEQSITSSSATTPLTPKKINTPKSKTQKKRAHRASTSAEERWMLTCGNYLKVSKNSEIEEIMSFDPKKHMLYAFQALCEQSKKNDKIMRLKIKNQLFIIDYNRDWVFHDQSILTEEYANTCQQEINLNNIRIHGLDIAEERLYQKRLIDKPELSHTIDSFIWTTSLVTSRGRLPKNTNLKKTISLKSWPNLTRLEQIPNAMQLAAIFSKSPGSLLEISNRVKFDQRYIFAFYNATLALDLIEFDGGKIQLSPMTPTKPSKVVTENRGFFSRLLKRIKS